MWEINSLQQWSTFFEAICLGGFLLLVYNIFKVDRIIFKRKTLAVFIEDIIFWLIAAFFTFCFMLLRTNGAIRGFVFIGEIIGFLLLRSATNPIIKKLAAPIRKILFKIGGLYRKTVYFCGQFSFLKIFSFKNAKTSEKSAEKP